MAHRSFTDCGGYTAAKAGQLGLSRVLAEEARPYDIRVTSLLPGATDTAIWDDRPGFDRTKMMKPEDVAGDLFDLCRRKVAGRRTENEITLFKSVGTAIEDLAAAVLVWRNLGSGGPGDKPAQSG